MTVSKHDTMREQIISEAKKVFIAEGFANTTMLTIARQINKKKSSLYYYFTSKEQIFTAIVEQETAKILEVLNAIISEIDEPKVQLSTYIKERHNIIKSLATEYGSAWNDYLTHSLYLNNEATNPEETHQKVLSIIIREGIKKGAFIEHNPKNTLMALSSLIHGLEHKYGRNTNPDEVNEAIEMMLTLIFNGILKD